MKVTIISYSLTGNNEALATSIASKLSAEHLKVVEPKPRTDIKIAFDMLFNRTPKINPISMDTKDSNLVVFIGPVWMGSVASPLRAYFAQFKTQLKRYAFISISGGADGPNPKLADELSKRIGKEPEVVLNYLIADLMPSNPKPTRNVTMVYHLNEKEVRSLTEKAVKTLQDLLAK
jgi:hypothetical protein